MRHSNIFLVIIAGLSGILLMAALEGQSKRLLEPSKQAVELPDISGQYFTTIIHDESPESAKFLNLFDTDPLLNRIKNRERHNELASTDPYYLENFKPKLKEAENFPIFLIQEPNGDSCLILSKDSIPDSAEQLGHLIRRRCEPDKPPVRAVVEKVKKVALVADTVRKIADTGGGGGDIISIILGVISSLGSVGWLTRSLKQVI